MGKPNRSFDIERFPGTVGCMGTHYRGTAIEIDALDAYIKLMRAAESVTVRTHLPLPDGLTVTQFGALEALLHRGPLCQSALAAKLLKSAGNVTVVVDHLEKRNLVRRQRESADRRYVKVHLTAKGRALIRPLFPKIAARITDEFATLSAAEQRTLAALCKKLGLGRTAVPPADPSASVTSPSSRP